MFQILYFEGHQNCLSDSKVTENLVFTHLVFLNSFLLSFTKVKSQIYILHKDLLVKNITGYWSQKLHFCLWNGPKSSSVGFNCHILVRYTCHTDTHTNWGTDTQTYWHTKTKTHINRDTRTHIQAGTHILHYNPSQISSFLWGRKNKLRRK